MLYQNTIIIILMFSALTTLCGLISSPYYFTCSITRTVIEETEKERERERETKRQRERDKKTERERERVERASCSIILPQFCFTVTLL